jgi:hypothetical protein
MRMRFGVGKAVIDNGKRQAYFETSGTDIELAQY